MVLPFFRSLLIIWKEAINRRMQIDCDYWFILSFLGPLLEDQPIFMEYLDKCTKVFGKIIVKTQVCEY